MREADLHEVTVARLEPGDVGEDDAAARIAKACAGEGVHIGAAFTGRANLYSESHGVAVVDAVRIAALNAIDESITVATIAPMAAVGIRQMLATIKIIPFAAPHPAVEEAERVLAAGPAIRIAAFKTRRAALISTAMPGAKLALLEKNRAALDARLQALGSSIVFERRVAHRTDAVATALAEASAAGTNPILVFGASAITDRRDVIPSAIERAGGSVEHFGMPVDPGNLLLLGRLGGATIIGLPGCARSPKLNGFDFVLQRLLAELPVARTDIAAMGVGGLLTEIHTRPQPRDRRPIGSARAPKIAAIVLAAGLSSRMGRNKLLADIDGKPLIRRVAEAAAASSVDPVIVVSGNAATDTASALIDLRVTVVENPDFRNGLSTSIKRGLRALPENCDGAIVLLGDMPAVTPGLIDKLVASFDPAEGRAICVATWKGKRGNPVLWARQFFADMLLLEGDVGAKHLMAANGELVCEVEAADDAPLIDIDTPEALAVYMARNR
ncbi:MAG: molybdopterin-binding/glycosyltransferase family 2 protein [Rhizomicrobium sp.]